MTSSSTTTQSGALMRFILWREKHISERVFVLILAFIVGLATAVAAFVLKELVHTLQHFATTAAQRNQYLYLVLPPVGIFATAMIVRYVVRDDISHGVTKILIALSQRKSRIKPHNMWSSVLSSAITIGMGGSVGAESPIVLTGAAIGSNLGRFFKMEQRNLMLLVGCGAAGAIAGIFKAPITGLVFVIEVLLMDLTLVSILPLLTTSVTSASLAYILTGRQAMFSFMQSEDFILDRIPYTLLLGILCGFVALYFSRIMFFLERRFKRIPKYVNRFLLSAVILSVLIVLMPPLYGEGYSVIEQLLSNDYSSIMQGSLFAGLGDSYWWIVLFLTLVLLFKVFASVATNSGGGCGGLFAPTLFVGGLTGFLFSHTLNYFPFIRVYLPEKNFILMGMAGTMAAVMHAPLTGVFLIAELTGGYNLFLPLMLVVLSAYCTIRVFMRHSIYSLRLAEEGKLLTHQKDQAVLTLMNLDSVIETEFSIVAPEMTLGDVVRIIGESRRNVFPVVDGDKRLVGIVLLDNIRNIMFRPELYDRFQVETFMVSPPAKILSTMSMEEAMRTFDDTKAWNLPVIDAEGHYLGFISKSKIFNTYREVLTDLSQGD